MIRLTATPPLPQDHFRLLPFEPAAIPALALDEIVAEKIRAASDRSKIRDLHDLSEIAKRPMDRDRIRALAVLKLWTGGGQGLNFDGFRQRVEGGADYDIADLRNLLRRDEAPDLAAMIRRTVEGFQFLGALTELERVVAMRPC